MRNRLGTSIALGVFLVAGAASAQNLDLDELAAALALPIVTGGQAPNPIKGTTGSGVLADDAAVTLVTVTNGKSTPVLLKVEALSGDPPTPGQPIDTWQSDSFQCLLTGRETTTFLVVPDTFLGGAGFGSAIYVECSTAWATDGVLADNRVIAARAANGILWIAAADPATGAVVSEDVLFGDAVVVDVAQGQAFSFGAIPFQAGQSFNDGNKIYRFDNEEYAPWPSTVAANFIAPDAMAPTAINAELILFTLDGAPGNPTLPRVALGGVGYDDDETYFDFQHEFDCFDIVALQDITANFTQPFLGSLSGHLQLVAQPVATANDSHDAAFGDGNNSRRRPVHGWLVQQVMAGATLVTAGQPNPLQAAPVVLGGGPAAWGRPLAQGRSSLLPFLGDMPPVLDADPLL